jgi:hypothetical protein
MSGYINGTELYWCYRGYAEGNNKLPMSSQNANYTEGYKFAIKDLPNNGNLGSIPVHNQKDFYLGMYQGGVIGDKEHGTGVQPYQSRCPSGHTAEYCAGFRFGFQWAEYALD